MNRSHEIKVWDPLVRIFHWTLVAAFTTSYISGEEWMDLHTLSGYVIATLLAVRLVWGLMGGRYARFSNFVYRPAMVWQYIKDVVRFRAKRYIGHNPAGGAMIVLLMLSLLLTVISGMSLYGIEEHAGPLAGLMSGVGGVWEEFIEETHELFANLTVLLVVIHVGGVIWESLLHKENLIRAMVNGKKRVSSEDRV